MKWSLKHAYDNVPHYRAAFDAAGVHPDDLRTLADLAKFPFTGKKEPCATTTPSACLPCRARPVVRIHASSGTTGKATVVGYTQNDIDTWANVVARSIRAAGGPPWRHGATSPTATACSPAASVRTTAPSVWAAR